MFRIESGPCCCTTSGLKENSLAGGLGVMLADTGDFCFVFICQGSTPCQPVSGQGFVPAS